MLWGWRVPFLVAAVSLAAGAILRYNMPESVEFNSNHEELDDEYHRRLQKQLAKRHQKQLRYQAQQHHVAARDSEGGVGTPVSKDVAGSELQGTPRTSAGGSAVEEAWAEEAGEEAVASRHYVPLLELFRGYWSGLVLHVAYAACEDALHQRQLDRLP